MAATWSGEDGGAHGVLYTCGARTKGIVQAQETLQGKRVRGIFGARHQFVAVVDAHALDWPPSSNRSHVLEQETVALRFAATKTDTTRIQQVAFGVKHRVALTVDGRLFSWGARDATLTNGELGHAAGGGWHPVTLTPRTNQEDGAESRDSTLAKAQSGEALNFQVPHASTDPLNAQFDARADTLGHSATSVCLPRLVHTPPQLVFTAVACGAHHSMAITHTGDLYAWGRNFEGQLGIGSALASPLHKGICAWPKYVSALLGKPRATSVSCGDCFTIVLLADGSLWRCGERVAGFTRSGQDHQQTDARPRQLLARSTTDRAPFVSIATGSSHALALTQSGQIFAWGLNTYGQLGLGLDHQESSDVPRPLETTALTAQWAKVVAGGHYSAAIASNGQLFTWGNGHYGQLGHGVSQSTAKTHPCEFAPRAVDALRGMDIASVVCDQRDLYAFAPTLMTDISPRAGELHGGYEMRIRGSGFWSSEDLTVRFVPLTQARLPRGALARYDEERHEIVCTVPKFSLAGEFAVEIAMDGKHFTDSGQFVFEAFKRPVVVDVSRWEVRVAGGDEIVVTLEGDLPRSCAHPLLRVVPWLHDGGDGNSESLELAQIVSGTVDEPLSSPRGSKATSDCEPRETPRSAKPSAPAAVPSARTRLMFVAPALGSHGETRGGVQRCHLELSFNDGFTFVPIHLLSTDTTGTKPLFVLQCHDAVATRVHPNSFLARALPTTIAIDVRHLVEQQLHGGSTSDDASSVNTNLSVELEISQLNVNDTAAQSRVNVALPIVSVTPCADGPGGNGTITCSVPLLTEWKLSKLDAKTQDRVEITTDWWKFVPRWGFQASVKVSLNNRASVLPALSPTHGASVFGVFTVGKVLSGYPLSTPQAGGTLVSVAADYLNFDTEDAVVLLQWKGGRDVRVPARCIVPSTSATASDNGNTEKSTALARRIMFTTPALPFPPPPLQQPANEADALATDEESAISTTAVASAPVAIDAEAEIALGASEEVSVVVSLDGRSFQKEPSLRLMYLRLPELLEISPAEAHAGTRMVLKADSVPPSSSSSSYVRLTTATLGVSMAVTVEINEVTNTIEFELPQLPVAEDDVVQVAFSLDGQQFTGGDDTQPDATTPQSGRSQAISFRYHTALPAAAAVADEIA